jgi:hypothetical protein
MRARILDLDGAVAEQSDLLRALRPEVHDLRAWGPALRLGCSWRRFRAFERALVLPGATSDQAPQVTFLGSGHFHHLSLALLRRMDTPFNLLVLDALPDYRRGLPFLCHRSWLRHVRRLTQAQRVFHVGCKHWAVRPSQGRAMALLPLTAASAEAPALRTNSYQRCNPKRLEALLGPHALELRRRPLYISLDKSVLVLRDAEVNGEPGHLWRDELTEIIGLFIRLSAGHLHAMDVVGDWSPVQTGGWLRQLLARSARCPWQVHAQHARTLNQRTNLSLMMRLFPKEVAMPLAAA